MLGKRLKQLRESQGTSLSELADRAGVSKSYLSMLERDIQSNPSIQFIDKLANVLKIPVDYLLQDITERTDPVLDLEWYSLIQEAKESGMSIEQFRTLLQNHWVHKKNLKLDQKE